MIFNASVHIKSLLMLITFLFTGNITEVFHYGYFRPVYIYRCYFTPTQKHILSLFLSSKSELLIHQHKKLTVTFSFFKIWVIVSPWHDHCLCTLAGGWIRPFKCSSFNHRNRRGILYKFWLSNLKLPFKS